MIAMQYSKEQILFLSFLPGVGPVTLQQILSHYSDFESLCGDVEFLERLPVKAKHLLLEYIDRDEKSRLMQQVLAEIERVNQTPDCCLVTIVDQQYPTLLKEISGCPPFLYVKGDPVCLGLPQIAIVGSRNTSNSGRQTAHTFAKELGASGFVVTSGLAMGVDTEAHSGALAGNGKTIGVIGTGIDQVYPKRNIRLAEEIVATGGAIVSEFPIGTSPVAQNFPKRNRTISGLSCGTLVVEAALRSGSLITARYAMEQNRELFAIPGSIHNPLARGCHSLIKQGAKLVETAQDIVDELSGLLSFQWQQLEDKEKEVQVETQISLSDIEIEVLKHIGFDQTGADEITERSGLSVADVISHLMSLELKGLIYAEGTGYIRANG